ncbi:hypothetical protein HYFRA_00009098 [Hymenoscyphus fraxineus]|uniref:Uncharacterized protein n=1 Tax=Hymenoscyphus fraxineus TaxID=746836 RepID=A0A9N9KU79_9HELO|nr:hypothetical protein HYFRA_00009098 [Hymenoscyphus fraxineus]
MAYYLETSIAIFSIFLINQAFKQWSHRRRANEAAKSHGCKPATRYPYWEPFLGLDVFLFLGVKTINGERSDEFVKIHAKYGPTFAMKCLSKEPMLQTSSPKNIQTIAATKFDDWGVGPIRGNIGAPFLDRGVFTEDGDFWKHSRALIRPTFNRAEIADLDHFENYVARFLKLIPRDVTTFDFQELTKRLFLDTSSEFLFGQSINSLFPETPFDTHEFMEAFDYSLFGLALRLVAGPLKPLFFFDPTWKKAYTKVHKFVDQKVQIALERQREISKTGKDPDEHGSKGKYVLLNQMALETQDAYDLRSQIVNIFFPARDTAAIAIGNVMFELARHPQYWDELRAEVEGIGERKLTYELIKHLKVAKAIINETLRLHLPGTRISRTSLRDTILPEGGGPDQRSPLFVPKGTFIEMDLYALHRNPKIWGDDAEEFRPSRWKEGRDLWEAKWQYAPFLGGIRMCPGQPLVLTQVTYLLVRLAQEFSAVENRDSVYRYVEEIKMTVESKNGVKISLTPA